MTEQHPTVPTSAQGNPGPAVVTITTDPHTIRLLVEAAYATARRLENGHLTATPAGVEWMHRQAQQLREAAVRITVAHEQAEARALAE